MRRKAISLLLVVSGLILRLARVEAQGPDPAAPTPAAAPPAPTASEAIQAARDLLDRIDAADARTPTKEALAELEKSIQALEAADPANPWLSYLLGRAYALVGRSGDAIDQLRKFVETRDGRNEWKAYRVLGDLFVSEYPRLAQANYEKAAELSPHEPSVLSGLSLCANREGDAEKSVALARRAVEADGRKSIRYVSRLARALFNHRDWAEAEQEARNALKLAEQAVQKQPGRREPLQVVVDQYGLLIDVVSARMKDEPSRVTGADYILLADLMRDRSDVIHRLAGHERVLILEAALEKTTPDATLLEEYGEALAEVGRMDEAIAQFEKIAEQDPKHAKAREWLDRLRGERK